MKKKINLKKKIDFSSVIGEVSAISLENQLHFIDHETIEGNMVLSGRYKMSSASRIEEDFYYEIPVEISLTQKVDYSTGTIDITDFYYDIVDEKSLLCDIEIEIQADEILEEDRECDGESILEKEIEIPHIEQPIIVEKESDDMPEEELDAEKERKPLEPVEKKIFHIESNEDTYGTFIVYIMRQNETINTILEKYQASIEEVEKYNDISNLMIGSKIIIPIHNDQNS